jgi:transposase-like protein
MDAKTPTVVDIPVSCAPKKAPCPHCGKMAKRLRTHARRVRTIEYHKIVFLDITVGEYQARCGCCSTFRTSPEGVLARCKYDNKVREAVLDRILDDGMNVEATRHSLERDFLLNLSTGFVYDCLYDACAKLDMAEHRAKVLQCFSGTLCVDELHLGQYTLLLATDPISDIPVAFALVDENDQDHMRRFLKNLKNHGLEPKVVITDGSSLYPTLLKELWPDAEHQLCVFHVLQDVNKKVLKAVLRLRRGLNRRGNRGRKRRRGRPTKAQKRRGRKQDKKLKEQAKFVFTRRHLIVKRRDRLKEHEQKDLATMLQYLPELRVLRDFADAMQPLFAAEQTEEQAQGRWRRLQKNAKYLAVPELKSVLETVLSQEKFVKMIAFLRNPAATKVRTNNHVERCNRKLRYWEKVRYKWRRRRTLVRFLVLAMDHWWRRELPRLEAAQPRAKVPSAKAKRKHSPNREEISASKSNSTVTAMPDKPRNAA